jgi:nitrogen regulatory protein PII
MTLSTKKRTLLTIITESAIEEMLLKDLEKLGVRGYTVSDARGRGAHGRRDASWGEVSNIRIEVICPRALAEAAIVHIQSHYYADYAMVTFLHEVEITRPEKF